MTFEERLYRAQRKMIPGTFAGRSRAATPQHLNPKRAEPQTLDPVVTTGSGNNGEFASYDPLTLPFPDGADGDTIFVWLSIDGSSTPTVSGDMDFSTEVSPAISSTGRLRRYVYVRQPGDTSVTFTPNLAGFGNRISGIIANVPASFDTTTPAASLVAASSTTVTPTSGGGPGLLVVWFSNSNIALTPTATLLEDPDNDGDVTVGFELRLYQIEASTGIAQTTPTNPSFSLFIRGVSYTTLP